jgi:hypothetical protein
MMVNGFTFTLSARADDVDDDDDDDCEEGLKGEEISPSEIRETDPLMKKAQSRDKSWQCALFFNNHLRHQS